MTAHFAVRFWSPSFRGWTRWRQGTSWFLWSPFAGQGLILSLGGVDVVWITCLSCSWHRPIGWREGWQKVQMGIQIQLGMIICWLSLVLVPWKSHSVVMKLIWLNLLIRLKAWLALRSSFLVDIPYTWSAISWTSSTTRWHQIGTTTRLQKNGSVRQCRRGCWKSVDWRWPLTGGGGSFFVWGILENGTSKACFCGWPLDSICATCLCPILLLVQCRAGFFKPNLWSPRGHVQHWKLPPLSHVLPSPSVKHLCAPSQHPA